MAVRKTHEKPAMSRTRKKNPYRGSRRFDASCRSHGSCPYCREGRRHRELRQAGAHDHGASHGRYLLDVRRLGRTQ